MRSLYFITLLWSLTAFAQSDTIPIKLRPISSLYNKMSLVDTTTSNGKDTVGRKEFCDKKRHQYDSLKQHLRFKLDSAKKAITVLNGNEKGPYFYYLVIKEYSGSYFKWEGCRNYTVSHDYVDLLISFEKKEKFRILIDGFSSGQTFYRED